MPDQWRDELTTKRNLDSKVNDFRGEVHLCFSSIRRGIVKVVVDFGAEIVLLPS